MPKLDLNAPYTSPTDNKPEVTDGALTAFQNNGAELCAGLGLKEGGFAANADRMFMLDDRGRLTSIPLYDDQQERNMTAAALDGRLYVMGKDYRLRQVRLEGNENDGFAFAVTNSLGARQMPRNSIVYFVKYFLAICDDFAKDMSELWRDMKQDAAEIWSNMKEDWAKIRKGEFSFREMLERDWGDTFGRRDKKVEKAEVKVEEGSLIPEEETLQTEQTVSTTKAEEIQQPTESTMTREELLAMNPTQQTTQMFEKYMEALVQRRNDNPVKTALEKADGKPADYYEALAQELEGKIAGDILRVAPNKESDPAGREKFLHDQKPVMASISKGLRGFVETKVESALVEDYYKAHADKKDGVDIQKSVKQMKLEGEASIVVGKGAGEYLAHVQAENKANQQEIQQLQPQNNQVVQQQMQMQQPQPQPEPQPQPQGMSVSGPM